jgi:hypothetical protein
MQNFETNTLNKTQLDYFKTWFNEMINTEYEVNQVGFDEYYLVCFDLTEDETVKVMVQLEGMRERMI